MILQIQIKLTTPLLGDKFTKEKIRRFEKADEDNYLKINRDLWCKAIQEADSIKTSGKRIKDILPPDKILSPTLRIYRRMYNKRKIDVFESIQKQTVLTFQLAVKTKDEQSPDVETVKELFELIGKHIGLSDWGSKFGYGRFKVLYVKDITNES